MSNYATGTTIYSSVEFMHIVKKYWNKMTSGSTNRKILGAALVVGGFTFCIKLISLVKESIVAASYGTGSDFDAFIIALLLPMTLLSILSGSLNAALVPTYIEVREREGIEAAQRLYTTILMWNTILLVTLSLVMALTARLWLPVIASGFSPSKMELTRKILYCSLPIVLLTGFSTTWGALLNAGEKFALVAFAPAMQPLAIILTVSLLLRSAGIFALLIGTVLGVLLETAVIGTALSRSGHPLLPHWHGLTSAFRKVRAQYGACIAGAFLVSGMGLVDQGMASTLGPRSNSSLEYGSKLVGLILSLGASSLGTAILPQLSKMVAIRDWKGIQHFLKYYGMLIGMITIPITCVLILMSRLIIQTMYQHGAFSSADTDLVVKIQILYLLRIPFSTILVLVTRTLTALRANHILMMTSIGTFTLNALLDYLFIKKYGIAGITLSTSVCSLFVLSCLSYMLYRKLKSVSRDGVLDNSPG